MLANTITETIRQCNYLVNRVLKMSALCFLHAASRMRKLGTDMRLFRRTDYPRPSGIRHSSEQCSEAADSAC